MLVGCPAQTASAFNRLKPAVLVTALTVTELAISSTAVPKPSPVSIAPAHGGMARLSGYDQYQDSRRGTKGGHQSQY